MYTKVTTGNVGGAYLRQNIKRASFLPLLAGVITTRSHLHESLERAPKKGRLRPGYRRPSKWVASKTGKGLPRCGNSRPVHSLDGVEVWFVVSQDRSTPFYEAEDSRIGEKV